MSASNVKIHNCDKCEKPIGYPRGGLRLVLSAAEWVGGLNGNYIGPAQPSYSSKDISPATPPGEPFTYPPPNTGYPNRDDDRPAQTMPREVTLCRDCLAKTLGFETDAETRENRSSRAAYYEQLYSK